MTDQPISNEDVIKRLTAEVERLRAEVRGYQTQQEHSEELVELWQEYMLFCRTLNQAGYPIPEFKQFHAERLGFPITKGE